MTGILNARIIASIAALVFVGAIIASATGAFFSDTETSTGNTFTAGDIDLQIDNESYTVATSTQGSGPSNLVASPWTSWGMTDIIAGTHKFFDFTDLKPGDVGEDTISIHVGSNNAWMCAAARVTSDLDNSMTEPEDESSPLAGDGTADGDLDTGINFMFWRDDGDNVLEVGETPFLNGSLASMGAAGQITLADSQSSILGGTAPIPGNTTFYIGKAWCYGALSAGTVPQDNLAKTGTNGPLVRGTGVVCNGAAVGNEGQTDSVQGDMQFYAVQSRNNASFTCANGYTPTWPNAPVQPTVGALLTAYVQPTGAACDINVDSALSETGNTSATINGGIALAAAGQTVCVDDGTYVEDVNVNKDITLSGDGATLTSTIQGVGTGEAGALVISANGATVEGFNVIGTGVSAIRISGARDGITVRYNHATAATGKNAFLTDGGQSNHTISNNLFDGDASQLVYVNGFASVANASTNVDFTSNTFGGTATGPLLGMEANGSSITLNKFSGTSGFTGVENWEGDNLVNQNNFNVDAGAGPIHVTNNAAGGQVPGSLNAENNWWGDADPSDNTTGLVDSSPSEAAAFPQN